MKKISKIFLILSIVVIFVRCGYFQQNGKIVEREKVDFSKYYYAKKYIEKYDINTNNFIIYKITYMSDGLKVKGYLGTPRPIKSKLPAIILNRGGNREFSKLKPRYLIPYLLYGYVVVGSQYRGNDGGEGEEEFGGRDVDDVLNLIPLLKHEKYVNMDRIYMVGYSRGGLMTYLALLRTSKIKAACVISAPTDLFQFEKERPDMEFVFRDLIGGTSKEVPEEFKKRSPIYYADKINTPILILHGTADWRVNFKHSVRMAKMLKKYNKIYKLVIYPGGTHGLHDRYWSKSFMEQLRFLNEH